MGRHVVDQWPDPPAAWSPELRRDFVAGVGSGVVGTRLVYETDRVRVWHLCLGPGERIGFHTHVLDYFWTVMTSGRARSRYDDGSTREVSYTAGDTQHLRYAAGQSMIHDLENIGDTELVFATVEFLDSANAALAVPEDKRAPDRAA